MGLGQGCCYGARAIAIRDVALGLGSGLLWI